MKFRWDNRYLHWGVTAFLVIAASMLFYYGIFHMKTLIGGVRAVFGIMAPIVYGVVIAYVLSPVVKFMEERVCAPILKKKQVTLQKKGRRILRWICVLLSVILFLTLIYTLIMMILPQLIRSIMNIIYSFPSYMTVLERWLNAFVERGWTDDRELIDMLNRYSIQAQEYLTNNILPQMQAMLGSISAGVFDALRFLGNFLVGTIISIYVLVDKEGFVARSKMLVYAVFSRERATAIIHAMRFTHKTFGGFFSGKILDSAIMGVLCYIGITIMDMPYTILISVVIGVTNIIPFFGPYVGAIPCGLLILLVNPVQGIYFAIFILVLQQFDGNILGPKILGDSTGLSSFMVIVAIMIGGGFFGIPGMIVGVPLFAVIYAAGANILNHVLKSKKLPAETEEYYNIDCLDEQTGEPLPLREEKRESSRSHVKKKAGTAYTKIYSQIKEFLLFVWKSLREKSSVVYKNIKNMKNK